MSVIVRDALRRRVTRVAAGSVLATCLALTACSSGGGGSASSGSGSRKVVAAVTTAGGLQWPYYVAQEKGFFKEANIDLDLSIAGTNTKEVQGLLSGSLNIAGGSPDVLIKAVAQNNSDLVVVGAVLNRPSYSLVVQPDVKSYADLRGKRIGVSAALSMDALFMNQLLERNGVKPGEVEIVEIGGTSERYAALKAKGVAAGLLTQPQDFKAMREGFGRLGTSQELVKDMVWSGYNTTRKWAKDHEALLLDFLGVIRQAHRWLYDPKNRDEAIDILAKNANVAQEDAEATYEMWIEGEALSKEGEATQVGVKAMIDALVQTKQISEPIPVDSVLDPSYLEKVRQRQP